MHHGLPVEDLTADAPSLGRPRLMRQDWREFSDGVHTEFGPPACATRARPVLVA